MVILICFEYLVFCCSCCSIETITLGDKRIGIKTSILEEKATACNMLCCYADELKEGFLPWIDQVDFVVLYFIYFICIFQTSVFYWLILLKHLGCFHIGSSSQILLP